MSNPRRPHERPLTAEEFRAGLRRVLQDWPDELRDDDDLISAVAQMSRKWRAQRYDRYGYRLRGWKPRLVYPGFVWRPNLLDRVLNWFRSAS